MAVYLVSSQMAQATSTASGSDPVTSFSTQIVASATSVSSGNAAASVLRPAGGFADIAVCNSVSPDPAMSYIAGSDRPTMTTAWQRMSLTATAPIDYNRGPAGKLWSGAAYASVGLRFDDLPAGSTVAFDRVQFGKAPSGNLLNRSASFHDDHMCYEGGPGTMAIRTRERSLVGGWSAKVVQLAAPPVGATGWGLDPHTDALAALEAGGGRVTARVSVSTDIPRRWRVRVRAYDSNYAQVYDGLSAVGDNTSLAGGVWSTAQASVTVPSTARYASVTPFIFWDGTPVAGWYYYSDSHYLAYDSGSAAYRVPAWEPPRNLKIRIKPKRVNLLNNPGFTADLTGWGVYSAAGAPYPMTRDGAVGRRTGGSAKFQLANTYTPNLSVVGVGAASSRRPDAKGADMLRTGVPHTISAWVNVPAGYPPVAAGAWDPVATIFRLGPDSDWIKANRPDLVQGSWVRVYYTWTPPDTTTREFFGGVLAPSSALQNSASGMLFWVDDVLLEETSELHDAFDGDDISADYLWQGAAHMSRSLYFPGRARNVSRLTEILKDNVPWGTTFDLLFS